MFRLRIPFLTNWLESRKVTIETIEQNRKDIISLNERLAGLSLVSDQQTKSILHYGKKIDEM